MVSKNPINQHSNKIGWFHDAQGRLVLAQKPNAPIIVAGLALVIRSIIVGPELLLVIVSGIYFGALSYWAYLELRSGVTYTRRLLGAAVLLLLIQSLS